MLHIVVVEDEQKDRELIIDYIEKYATENEESIKVSQFENARLFLSNYNPIYDLVFLDIQMPLLDGMQAAERLRELDRRFLWCSSPICPTTP